MSKRRKVLVLLAAVILLLVVLRPHFRWTKQESNTTTSVSFQTVTSDTGNSLRTYSKFGIVTPPVPGNLKRFQTQIAEKLQEKLSGAGLAHKSEWSSKGHTTSSVSPRIKAYKSTDEALKDGAEFILILKPKFLRCSFLPIIKTWQTTVDIEGNAACQLQGDPEMSTLTAPQGVLGYGADISVEQNGRMTGIFSTSYLVSEAAESVAKEACNKLTENVKDAFDSKCEDLMGKIRKQ